jgi:hypothetical protein
MPTWVILSKIILDIGFIAFVIWLYIVLYRSVKRLTAIRKELEALIKRMEV